MTACPSNRIVCLLGALVVSTGLAQEILPAKAIPSSSTTNYLLVVGVFSGPNWDVRYDAGWSDVGVGMRLNLPIGPSRFDYGILLQDSTGRARRKKPIRRFDVSTPVQTQPEAAQWRRAMESAERENLRLMNDYRSRATSPATPPAQPQFHPSAVEEILNRADR